MGLARGRPGCSTPYSVSIPITRRTLTSTTLCRSSPVGEVGSVPAERRARTLSRWSSEVLTGVLDGVDGARRRTLALLLDDRADEDDALALLAADAGPVVGVGRVREVLVLL